ncbi:MAG: PhzF family phenazine biosynthesis protein [Planctomycetota bacterium JB042]
MPLVLHTVDAFTDTPFTGNPAAVLVLPAPREDDWMQRVAREMNLSETAFLVRRDDGAYDLRWFTPTVEAGLCGHATLASAHVLFETAAASADEVLRFHTKSGELRARRAGRAIVLDFPAAPAAEDSPPDGLLEALGVDAVFVGRTRFDFLVEVGAAAEVRAAAPDHRRLGALAVRGVILTAPAEEGEEWDVVSRFFAPGSGIDEDPVTGSAHCAIGPHWVERLGKNPITARQASPRGGTLGVTVLGDRVELAGDAVTVLRSELLV